MSRHDTVHRININDSLSEINAEIERWEQQRDAESGVSRPGFAIAAEVCVICYDHSPGIQTHKPLYSLLRL